ncbi:MAG: hypothetical protein PHI23_01530 [Candidatus Peribacteraceae bacterium]|nr:hypothetical protein [Candidatus Peribacteraceae bacterium]
MPPSACNHRNKSAENGIGNRCHIRRSPLNAKLTTGYLFHLYRSLLPRSHAEPPEESLNMIGDRVDFRLVRSRSPLHRRMIDADHMDPPRRSIRMIAAVG